jgi:hypothetical protein
MAGNSAAKHSEDDSVRVSFQIRRIPTVITQGNSASDSNKDATLSLISVWLGREAGSGLA